MIYSTKLVLIIRLITHRLKIIEEVLKLTEINSPRQQKWVLWHVLTRLYITSLETVMNDVSLDDHFLIQFKCRKKKILFSLIHATCAYDNCVFIYKRITPSGIFTAFKKVFLSRISFKRTYFTFISRVRKVVRRSQESGIFYLFNVLMKSMILFCISIRIVAFKKKA